MNISVDIVVLAIIKNLSSSVVDTTKLGDVVRIIIAVRGMSLAFEPVLILQAVDRKWGE